MAQTVVGIFDNLVEAQQAVQKLCNTGLLKERIDITESASGSAPENVEDEKQGGISGFFKNLFSDEEEGDKYVRLTKYSESIVTVRVDTAEEAEAAGKILRSCGAINVDIQEVFYGSPITETTDLQAPVSKAEIAGESVSTEQFPSVEFPGNEKRIPIGEINLQVGKREVLTGGTHLRSRLIDPQAVNPGELQNKVQYLNRNTEETSESYEVLKNFTAYDLDLIETKEVPVVAKEARVVEEITIGKEINETIKTVSNTIRKTEIDVENLKTDNTKKPG